jgi:hypothetical protein
MSRGINIGKSPPYSGLKMGAWFILSYAKMDPFMTFGR